MNKIKVTVLEYNKGNYKGVDFSNVLARYNGRIFKFKLDSEKVSDLTESIDQEVEFELDIVNVGNLQAGLKVIGVEV